MPNFEPADLKKLRIEKIKDLIETFESERKMQAEIAKDQLERSLALTKKWEIEIGEKIKIALQLATELRLKIAASVLKNISAREALEAMDKSVAANAAAAALAKALTQLRSEKARRDLIPIPPTQSPTNSKGN